MSWQTYVDSNLVGTGSVHQAAITSLDGNVWAKSEKWNATPEEFSNIAKNFNNSETLSMSGFVLGGQKYFYLSGDPSVVRGKKGTDGIHIAKTKTALIFGAYAQPIVAEQCASVVESLADYLRDQNY